MARVMAIKELEDTCGHGWIEIWYHWSPTDGVEEDFELVPCAWCMGGVVWGKNDFTTTDAMAPVYGKPGGLRVWDECPPPDAWGKAVTWNE